MTTFSRSRVGKSGMNSRGKCALAAVFLGCIGAGNVLGAHGQEQNHLSERIQRLSDAISTTQAQLEQSQLQLEQMRKELAELQRQVAQASGQAAPDPTAPDASQGTTQDLAAAVQEIRERQAVEESQIATHEQAKVETESKYPLKLTGMLLMNGFVNTGAVDQPATPTITLPGSGSVGATVRQTVLGFDARGPRLLGADSFADLRIDFAGSSAATASTSTYPEYGNSNSPYLRLRTVHAGLEWRRTQAYFAMDRPILSPDMPTSLTAVAEPALAWSGNLWTWNPQAVVAQDIARVRSTSLEFQAALIDPGDAPLTPGYTAQVTTQPTSAEQSSWPGVEAHIALLGSHRGDDRNHLGVGGYFARHQTSLDRRFDSWAATLDSRLSLPARLQLSGNFYRGLGLGGLGGGAYKDFVYKQNPNTGGYFFKALDDVGGWAQLKEKLSERLEFNGAYGMDNAFSSQMRRYIVSGGTIFQNLTINRTVTGNVIFSPSAYLLFSLEYRHLESSPIAAAPARSDVIGLAAGYKF